MNLQQYQSHKKVHAAKIVAVIVDGTGKIYGIDLDLDKDDKVNRLIFSSETNELLRKPKPEAGMWYVLYPDGYFSFHPENFLEEYSKVEDIPAKVTSLEQAQQIVDSEGILLQQTVKGDKLLIDKLIAENAHLKTLLEQYENKFPPLN